MKARLLVVDDSVHLIELLQTFFEKSEIAEIVRVAHDGEEAVNLLTNEIDTFDIMLLDIIMPRKDGIFVLDYMKEYKIEKDTIVMTSYAEENMIEEISSYGVKYFALKPFDYNDLEKKISKIILKKKEVKQVIDYGEKYINIKITKLLHALGIPSHIKGYQYIRTAIMMVYNNQELIEGITKELYPDLSSKYKTSCQKVERAIRHAIEVSWLRGDIDLMEEIFGNSVSIDKAKPTNSEFIVTIADKLKLEMIDIK
jgi:two-component system, response regulator, stage 0 sporulation protein A